MARRFAMRQTGKPSPQPCEHHDNHVRYKDILSRNSVFVATLGSDTIGGEMNPTGDYPWDSASTGASSKCGEHLKPYD